MLVIIGVLVPIIIIAIPFYTIYSIFELFGKKKITAVKKEKETINWKGIFNEKE
ncbi:MAG: hypothetical protein ACYDEX_19110 [Mobilitalea sp.]